MKPYEPKTIAFLELWDCAGFRLKVYTISRGTADARLIVAGKEWAAKELCKNPTSLENYGVGFLAIHDGEGENQVFLDFWVNENELVHRFFVSTKSDPGSLNKAPEDHNSVCVWDLAVQCFERAKWIKHVLNNPNGTDIEQYLSQRLERTL